MFNLEKSIQAWKRKLQSSPAFEDGDIAELESHLLDEIERLKMEGLSEEEAFETASEQIGEPEPIGDEFYKSRTTQKAGAVPPWKQRAGIFSHLPHFLKSTLRHLARNKTYTSINILGLVQGIAIFLIISTWVLYQLSFDKFHHQSDDIYRVVNNIQRNSTTERLALTSPLLGPTIVQEIPEIKKVARVDRNDAVVVRGDNRFNEDDILLTDPGFFEIFDFKLIAGNPATALRDPYSIIISEGMARKYFGDQEVMGKSIRLYMYDPDGRGADYTITGIIEDAPPNSHIQYTLLASFSTIESVFEAILQERGWEVNEFYTYLLIDESAIPAEVEQKLLSISETRVNSLMEAQDVIYSFTLQPLTDIYLFSQLEEDLPGLGSINYIIIFGSVGIFILLLAGINYINLATVLSIERVKSVVIRKVIGADKRELFLYMIGEAVLFVFMALACSLLIIGATKPFIASFIGMETLAISFNSALLLTFIATLGLGVLSGLFPASIIMKVDTIQGLKGKVSHSNKSNLLRKGLVIFQFSLTVILLAGITSINDQLTFIQSKSLGFDKSNLVSLKVNGSEEVVRKYDVFSEDLLRNPQVESITRSNTLLINGLDRVAAAIRNEAGEDVRAVMQELAVDYNYISTHELQVVSGRAFDKEIRSDSTEAILINEAALGSFGWDNPNQALDKEIRFRDRSSRIIGVVKNFHTNSLHHEIEPVLLYILENTPSRITVKTTSDNPKEALAILETKWKEYFPNSVFDYAFVDEKIMEQYNMETKFAGLMGIFSGLSLLIAGIGLFGLASFSLQRRTKEIGVRKVFGASTYGIFKMMSIEFISLVLIANIISWPFVYYLVQKWLNLFVYKSNLEFRNFIYVTLISLIIALAATGFQSVKSAMTDPINSLRND